MDVINIIKSNYKSFTNTQKNIADYLITNPSRVCYITLSKLSLEIGCSEVTLLNFCKKIGFKNFSALKKSFRSFTEDKVNKFSSSSVKKLTFDSVSSDTSKLINNIIEVEKQQLMSFYNELDFNKIDIICDKILKSKYIYILGHDASKHLGSFLLTRLVVLNLSPVLVDLEDMYKTEFTMKQITDEDIVIFISFPNYYYAAEGIAKIVTENTDRLVLITDSDNCPVSPYTNDILYCETDAQIFNNSWLSPLACLNIITNIIAIKNIK